MNPFPSSSTVPFSLVFRDVPSYSNNGVLRFLTDISTVVRAREIFQVIFLTVNSTGYCTSRS